jgi:hypothetical protein
MPIKQPRTGIIRKPTPQMMKFARSMAVAKAESEQARKLGVAHILAQEAELEMYKHAMNLSEEMWKHHNGAIARSRKPSARMLQERDQAERDFALFSQKHDSLRRLIEKKMAPKKPVAAGHGSSFWN